MSIRKLLKQLVCVGIILILSSGIVFANDEDEGGGVGGNSIQPDPVTEEVTL